MGSDEYRFIESVESPCWEPSRRPNQGGPLYPRDTPAHHPHTQCLLCVEPSHVLHLVVLQQYVISLFLSLSLSVQQLIIDLNTVRVLSISLEQSNKRSGDSTRFVVATNDYIFLFDAHSPTPLCYWKVQSSKYASIALPLS